MVLDGVALVQHDSQPPSNIWDKERPDQQTKRLPGSEERADGFTVELCGQGAVGGDDKVLRVEVGSGQRLVLAVVDLDTYVDSFVEMLMEDRKH